MNMRLQQTEKNRKKLQQFWIQTCPNGWKNIPSCMPLLSTNHVKVPSMVAQCAARRCDKVPCQWRNCDAVRAAGALLNFWCSALQTARVRLCFFNTNSPFVLPWTDYVLKLWKKSSQFVSLLISTSYKHCDGFFSWFGNTCGRLAIV